MSAPPPNIEPLLGPFVVETVLAAVLFGLTLNQAGVYFQRCENDHKVLVGAVAVLYLLSYFQIITLSITLYKFCVTSFGDYGALVFPPWSFPLGATLTGIFSLVAQTYYARQVYILGGRKKVLPSIIMFFAIVSAAFTVVCTGKGYSYGDFRKFPEFEWGVLVWLCTAAAADVLITGGLVYHLRRHRQETSFEDTRSLLGNVIANVIENNALTCVVACVDSVLFAKAEKIGNWHVVANGQLVGLYFISLLTSLNTRHRHLAQRETVRGMSLSVDQLGGGGTEARDLELGSGGGGASRVSGGTALMRIITRGSVVDHHAQAGRGRRASGGGAGGGGFRLPELNDDKPTLEDPFTNSAAPHSPRLPRSNSHHLPVQPSRDTGRVDVQEVDESEDSATSMSSAERKG